MFASHPGAEALDRPTNLVAVSKPTPGAVYNVPDPLPLDRLLGAVAAAEAGLARLDERLANSPVESGWQARSHFADACACLGLEGKLAHVEDVVLHDAEMHIYPPTPELVRARLVLNDRRRVAAGEPGWSMSSSALRTLQGRADSPATIAETPQADDCGADAEFRAMLAEVDAAIKSSNSVLAQSHEGRALRSPLIYDSEFDEEERLAGWRRLITQTDRLPPTLQAAIALDAWTAIDPLEHQSWLGPLLVADNLRRRAKLRALPSLSHGLKLVDRQRRRADDQTIRIAAGLEAIAAIADSGLKEHNRLATARRLMMGKLKNRRSTSRLPALIEYVMAQPVVTTGMIAKELRITLRSAQDLVFELDLRELTGRGRYRGWGVL